MRHTALAPLARWGLRRKFGADFVLPDGELVVVGDHPLQRLKQIRRGSSKANIRELAQITGDAFARRAADPGADLLDRHHERVAEQHGPGPVDDP